MGIDLNDCLRLSDNTAIKDRKVYTELGAFVTLITRNLFVFAGIILFAMLILAGYKFILGGKKGLEEARSLISTAIIGFLIMFSAYWIVQIVQLLTGANIPI